MLERLESRRLFTTYSFTDLGAAGLSGFSLDVNDTGQVSGNMNGHAAIWRDGVVTDLGTLGGPTSQALGLNDRGQVVGVSAPAAGQPSRAFLWSDGAMTDLGLGDDSTAVAVNDAGQVAANAGGRAFLWQDGHATDLGDLAGTGTGASAADINNAGQIVGSAWGGTYGTFGFAVSHAFVWQDGVMTDLGTPGFTDGSYAGAVNGSGQFVGTTTVFLNTGYGAAFVSRASFYDGHDIMLLPVPYVMSVATDLNDAGQVVGTYGGRAYLYEDGVVKDLNTLLPPGPRPVLAGATGINNSGQIVGYTAGPNSRPFLLTPDPPPPAAAEVQVFVDGLEVATDADTVGFGETPTGVPVTRTFVVRNVGGTALDLAGPIALPAGFTLVSGGFDAASLAPGGVATFVVRLDATAAGTFGGTLSFGTSDADEPTVRVGLSGAVFPERVIDDGSAGFRATGRWMSVLSGRGSQGDLRVLLPPPRRIAPVGRVLATASWAFTGLEPGTYRVSATWTPGIGNATNAPFTVSTGAAPTTTVPVNQAMAPDDLHANGAAWEDLGTFTVADGTLSVRTTNRAGGRVIADAVRIERVATPVTVAAIPPPQPPAPSGAGADTATDLVRQQVVE